MSSSTPSAVPALTRPDGTPIRALVVDDEPALVELIQMALRYEGWQVETASDGATALSKARSFEPDVIVLDIMLPGLDGLDVLRRMRAAGDDVAVLFLTAKDAVSDRVVGLTAGGDDYVTKPFSLEEVVARLRALLRRTGRGITGYTDPILRVGDLTLDEESYEVTRGGRLIELTAKEFELLRYLMRNPRRVVSKMQILDRVWSYEYEGSPSIVEIYISYLRKKIDVDAPPMIHTVRGVGYLIKPAS
ncbi:MULTISPECIES: response regulator transcription factor [unclassified Salinibacterium]|uniref:response regulator transcription factor n=1 Tax=unclassified Salinibacterium TaxID=2632331 RepID=UPI00141E5900|nr:MULTISPECIES: response regulator transcription factor [unclassified Salinibacterium]